MRMQKYNASEKCRPANSPAALTKEFLRLAYLSVRMFPLLQRFVHPSDNSSPDLSFETHYGCSPVWDSHPTSVSYPSKYEIVLLRYNTPVFCLCKGLALLFAKALRRLPSSNSVDSEIVSVPCRSALGLLVILIFSCFARLSNFVGNFLRDKCQYMSCIYFHFMLL